MTTSPSPPFPLRASFPVWCLSIVAVALIAANWYVRRPTLSLEVANESPAKDGSSEHVPIPRPAPVEMPASTSASPSPQRYDFNWAGVETTDYNQYMANLRAIGFPEETIREILIADINKLYSPREEPLKPKPIPHDAPNEVRNRPLAPEWDRIRQLREVQVEKQAMLKELLGVYVPREILRTPHSRNYETFEYA